MFFACLMYEQSENKHTMPVKYYWDYKNQQNLFRMGAKVLRYIGVEQVKKRDQ
jgi:hypothetical protein